MRRRRSEKKKRHKAMGIGAIVEPGVGAIYSRGAWMKKLDDLGEGKRKRIKRSRVKRKQP